MVVDVSLLAIKVTVNCFQVTQCLRQQTMSIMHITPGGRMSRGSISNFGKSANLNIAAMNPGRVKPMTLKFIRVASYPGARHY